MIPQSFKDIISNVEYAGLLNTLSLILFIIVFVGITLYVFNRPKKYYEEEENAPLNDDLDMDDDEKRTSH